MGTSRVYTIKADLFSSISSTYTTTYAVTLGDNGVRAIDGAGIDQYSPTTGADVTKTVTVAASLSESASLSVSTDSSSPVTQEVVAASGPSNNQADKVVLLTFDIKADKSDVNITDLKNFIITKAAATASAATASTTYLYEGNGTSGTLLGSVAMTTSDADFTNISSTIPAGTTKTYTIAVDIRSADAVQATFVASFTGNTTDVIGLSADGSTVGTVTGSATGNNILVRNVGPVFSLTGAPAVTRIAAGGYVGATSSAQATWTLHMAAVGADVEFGGNSSTTFALVAQANVLAGAGAESIVPYLSGSASHPVVSSSTAMTIDTSKVTTITGLNSYKLAQNQSIDIPVTFTMQANTSAGVGITFGTWAFGLERLNWLTSATGRQSSTFMSGLTAWRTPSITLP